MDGKMETENLIRQAIESLPYGEDYKELRYLLHQALAIAKEKVKEKACQRPVKG